MHADAGQNSATALDSKYFLKLQEQEVYNDGQNHTTPASFLSFTGHFGLICADLLQLMHQILTGRFYLNLKKDA